MTFLVLGMLCLKKKNNEMNLRQDSIKSLRTSFSLWEWENEWVDFSLLLFFRNAYPLHFFLENKCRIIHSYIHILEYWMNEWIKSIAGQLSLDQIIHLFESIRIESWFWEVRLRGEKNNANHQPPHPIYNIVNSWIHLCCVCEKEIVIVAEQLIWNLSYLSIFSLMP